MSRLVEFPLQGGGSVLVEVEPESSAPVTRGWTDRSVTEQAQQTFDEAVGRIEPVARVLIERMSRISDSMDEVGVEFGIELTAQAGAFVASAGTSANFKVSLTWRRSK